LPLIQSVELRNMKGQLETRPVEAGSGSELDAAKSAQLSAGAENGLDRISKFAEVSTCLVFLGWLWKENLRWLWNIDIGMIRLFKMFEVIGQRLIQ
jgi:hypothetical protein